ncbi:MAG: hypothetical protein ACK6CU_13650 [Deltaproteobacteria bacterium]
MRARSLLTRARLDFAAEPALERDARAAVLEGFGGGLAWMLARNGAVAGARERRRGHVVGVVKYGLCIAFGAVVAGLLALSLRDLAWPWASLGAASLAFVLAFYALESRWVFVFPAMADGDPHPFLRSWRLTREHGGTLEAMRVVMPIAAWMVFGSLVDGHVVRTWAIGCHAVLTWYRDLRTRGQAR